MQAIQPRRHCAQPAHKNYRVGSRDPRVFGDINICLPANRVSGQKWARPAGSDGRPRVWEQPAMQGISKGTSVPQWDCVSRYRGQKQRVRFSSKHDQPQSPQPPPLNLWGDEGMTRVLANQIELISRKHFSHSFQWPLRHMCFLLSHKANFDKWRTILFESNMQQWEEKRNLQTLRSQVAAVLLSLSHYHYRKGGFLHCRLAQPSPQGGGRRHSCTEDSMVTLTSAARFALIFTWYFRESPTPLYIPITWHPRASVDHHPDWKKVKHTYFSQEQLSLKWTRQKINTIVFGNSKTQVKKIPTLF